jgi:hypothetical protein
MTVLTTSSSEMPSSLACSGICLPTTSCSNARGRPVRP